MLRMRPTNPVARQTLIQFGPSASRPPDWRPLIPQRNYGQWRLIDAGSAGFRRVEARLALKSEIEAKIKNNGVKVFTLTVVDKDAAEDGKVVGTCDGGTNKIVYKRGAVDAPRDTTGEAKSQTGEAKSQTGEAKSQTGEAKSQPK